MGFSSSDELLSPDNNVFNIKYIFQRALLFPCGCQKYLRPCSENKDELSDLFVTKEECWIFPDNLVVIRQSYWGSCYFLGI